MLSAKDEQSWIQGYNAMQDRTVHGPLGLRLVSISDERAVIEAEITDALRQPMGLLHGGVSLLMGESVASLHAAWLGDLEETAPVGVDINGTHLRSATQGHVRAIARVLRKTRSFVFHEVDIEHVESGALLCKVRISNFYKPIT